MVFLAPASSALTDRVREGVGGGDPERLALFQVPTIPFPVLRAAVERKKAMGIARPHAPGYKMGRSSSPQSGTGAELYLAAASASFWPYFLYGNSTPLIQFICASLP